ncbi:acetate--CoA ligase family protein [Bacillus dakarensis]|uniref:acetate--CoA ligase family protein n=1 Tax=Robertmurraya dakarensis TaxID=1926278 RepID=UPI0009822421|nr:acetate--CoA ligase family protein [Bacillus dakarensis]
MSNPNLYQLLNPDSVAVIGVSRTEGSIGNTAIKNFVDGGFKGKVYGVNPRYQSVEGYPCYPSLADIPDSVDAVIIAVASHLVENAIHDCIAKKVKYVVIFSSGFAEKGAEGLQKQNEILALCQENGIRAVGPNTIGTYNLKNRILLSFTPLGRMEIVDGDVGVVCQSGATCITLLSTAMEENIGFNYGLTSGNQMDLTSLDFIDFLVEEEETNIIATYIEGVPDGKVLEEISKKALRKHKPIIILKAGRSEAGQRAALSHTASLTGSNEVFRMAAKSLGLTHVQEIEEMVDAIKAFRGRKRPKGNRVATVVISGATGIMLADKLAELDFDLIPLSSATQEKLFEEVPLYCSAANPVDIGQTLLYNPRLYKHCIETLVETEEVDMIVLHLPIGTNAGGLTFAQEIVDVSKTTDKPIIVITTGPERSIAEVRKFLTAHHIPAYSSIRSGAEAAKYLLDYERSYQKLLQTVENDTNSSLERHSLLKGTKSVTEPQVKKLLAQHNIPVPLGFVAKREDEIDKGLSNLKFPVAAKIVSEEITHKSDIGGVVLNIKNEAALREAFKTIMSNAESHDVSDKVDGVLIEEMVESPKQEMIVSIRKDPVFGPIILCGLGGIYVEIMKDVSQRLAPISEKEALEMLQELKCYPLLAGVRNGQIFDISELAKTLSSISKIAQSLEGPWEELEINPLVVLPKGEGVMALDGLITLSEEEGVTKLGTVNKK